MEVPNPDIYNCQTPEELYNVITYHLKQGGMRRDIYNNDRFIRTEYDNFETHRLYGITLNKYNEIRKSYPKLPVPQIDTSDPLSGLAQIQQLCTESRKMGNFLWKLYEKTLKVIVDAVFEKCWPK